MELSVIMATFNRREILRRTLLLYNEQIEMSGRFEMILVDDCSTDGTLAMVEALRHELAYDLQVLQLAANSGPAKARNVAIEAARGDVLFLTGDDILPDPGLLLQHLTWHTVRYPEPHVAVLGRVAWHPELDLTPLMQWLETSGEQFAYGDIQDGDVVPYSHLYTSNVSFKRRYLDMCAERFDERFNGAGFEDSEWAQRLARKGMELRYNAAAIGNHLHPTTLESGLRRARSLGGMAAILHAVNKEEFDRVTGGLFTPEKRWKLVLAAALLNPVLADWIYTPLARLCERRVVANKIFAAAFMSAMMAGVRGWHGSAGKISVTANQSGQSM